MAYNSICFFSLMGLCVNWDSVDLIWAHQDLVGLSHIPLGMAPGHRLNSGLHCLFILTMTEAQEVKANHSNTFNTSAPIIYSNIPLAKLVTWPSPRSTVEGGTKSHSKGHGYIILQQGGHEGLGAIIPPNIEALFHT